MWFLCYILLQHLIYWVCLLLDRQHWFISRLDGASVTAGGFTPRNSNVLIICNSSNQVYAFDVEAKQLGEWSMKHTFALPKRFQEFPGEVIGLSFPPSLKSSTVIIYSARCLLIPCYFEKEINFSYSFLYVAYQ